MERQVAVAYNTEYDVRMMSAGRQKFKCVIVNICSDHALESELSSERDVDSLTLMTHDIDNEDAGQQQVEVNPVSLLLNEPEIADPDILELLMPVGDDPEDILDHILFVAGDDE